MSHHFSPYQLRILENGRRRENQRLMGLQLQEIRALPVTNRCPKEEQ